MNYYFHVPFCASKCGYCAFYSLPGAGEAQLDCYLDHLERTAEPCGKVETLYIGGGTPTLFSEKQLERFFNFLKKRFELLNKQKLILINFYFTFTKLKYLISQ
jgi:oxygen-independent coproporphyrinogen-3 oxidase